MARTPRSDLGERFPAESLREYALLADGERGAIVGPRGDVAWLCVPRWDSEAVFAALAGGSGFYAVTPAGRFVSGGYYERGTLIRRSRWVTSSGVIECREALALPGGPDRVVLLRHVAVLEGEAELDVVLEPHAGYGREPVRDLRCEQGVWTGRSGGVAFRWTPGAPARVRQGVDGTRSRLGMHLVCPEGSRHDLVLELAPLGALGDAPVDPGAAWEATEAGWAADVPALADTLAPEEARHSYAVLRGLTGTGGGMVAAATTSLPERAATGRNYDYRYVWIRDQAYAGQAVAAAGAPRLLDDAVRFVAARLLEHGPKLAPAYTTTGAPVPDQRRLDLPGYPGGFDLVGNWVNQQFQLDAFGEALLLFAAAADQDRLDDDAWHAAEVAAGAIAERWREPDAGIWELEPEAWTHSRLICAAGLRSIARSRGVAATASAARWSRLADAIVADTARRGLHASGRWQRSEADAGLDAALLLPAVRGGIAADDPRTVATLEAYLAELTESGYAYRFRHDERPLAEAEGAFLLCGFVVALALEQQGRTDEALRWFERHSAARGTGDLFAEEYDVAQRQLRGNLPQAFVHALLIECAARLGQAPAGPR